ncbi:MAG TPA: 2-oxoglutarate dehydrogenase complex dihydrolipoyllysine-residue succinyltransferase [Lacunisphaera sp.]|nr:2-oxoglutarate dehydrogenase complex dihydrolipoyllysine-residue succinyltransferase [Lacunisphaera sp.]
MAIEVKIPPMGESITSGVLAKWHVQNGDVVAKDQALFELETDKITAEGTAESAGRITLLVEAGADVKIGQVVATIDEAATAPAPAAAPAQKSREEPPRSPPGESGPAVRRLAAETGINPATVAGTGKGGRVTKGDMLAASAPAVAGQKPEAKGEKPADAPGGGAPPPREAPSSVPSGARQTRTKLSKLRQTIANRLVAAQHEAAMLTTFNECDLSAVIELRKKYQEDFVKKHGVKLGFMSFFTKAVVHALKEVPEVNARIDGDSVVQNHYYDIGMAVSTDKGLMVPVIRDCDQLSLAGIEKAIAGAATKAREGKITLTDLDGGVFTITNGGIFGSMLSTPILNAPQSGILGLHAITERPVAVNGQVVIRPMMYLALSYDHRIVDGRQAVTFLVRIKQVIEDPARLLVGV